MDCFYAAIEMRDFPHLADKPVAVGGDPSRRGVIATCNYAARQFGVRSAMPTAHAFKLCRQLVLQPVRMAVYQQESQYIRAIFANYTDLIEPLSLDEAYLDVTQSNQCRGSATWMAQAIRDEIFKARQLTASAGVAPNKSLAKIASDWHKPNGQKVITPDEVANFMLTLSVRKLFGVGPKMEQKLDNFNIKTCFDLQQHSIDFLQTEFGSMGQKLYELARGIDERPVNPLRIRKSISVEETYIQDLPNCDACLAQLPELIARLQTRIQKAGKQSDIRKLFVKLKFNDFQRTTVERVHGSVDANLLSVLIQAGFTRKNLPVRLLGIGVRLSVSNFLG